MSLNLLRSDRHCGLMLLLLLSLGSGLTAQALTISPPLSVNFQGTYVDETCDVVINGNSSSETVTLPRVSNITLRNNGGEAGYTPFNIRLDGCPTGQTMKLVFNSDLTSMDTATGNLLNQTGSGFSRNVQIRIRNENGQQMVINDNATAQEYVIPVGGGSVSHQYSVSYFSTRPIAASFGIVQSIARITVDYQ